MSTQDDVVIRHATREDVPTILTLIRELAAYEKEPPSTVQATTDSLLATLAFAASPTDPAAGPALAISPARPARALLLCAPDGAPAGMALYFYNYSTWRARPGIHLEDLFVREPERRKGYGLRLLVALAQEVRAMGGGRLEWSVLKWNQAAIDFYERKVGASMLAEWAVCRVDGDALERLALRCG